MVVQLIRNKLLQSASYILGEYIVDCGDCEAIISAIGDKDLKGIFLTHCHHDHVYGLDKLLDFYPQAKVYCTQKTYQGLKDPLINLSYINPEYPFSFSHDNNVVLLNEGKFCIDSIMNVDVILSAGHSGDSVSYIIEDSIFTGDAHIPFAKVFAKWPTSCANLAEKSERKLLEIIRHKHIEVYPGHWKN